MRNLLFVTAAVIALSATPVLANDSPVTLDDLYGNWGDPALDKIKHVCAGWWQMRPGSFSYRMEGADFNKVSPAQYSFDGRTLTISYQTSDRVVTTRWFVTDRNTMTFLRDKWPPEAGQELAVSRRCG
jgi:hypothetical protein